MRITEISWDKDKKLVEFEINGTFITRFGVERIIRRIPGVRITKSQYGWRLSRSDDFTHFIVDGGTFVAYEPYGDSDLYRIVVHDESAIDAMGRVRDHFARHKRFGVI